MIKKIAGNICAPKGFLAAGIHVGVRKNTEKADLALIYSEQPAAAAGVFTINEVKAAPVILTEKHLKHGTLQAIIVNSGNANACTGKQGMSDAEQMAAATAAQFNISADKIAVSSTGVIGVPMPIEKITAGIEKIKSQLSTNGDSAALAIMTTDTFPKSIAVEIELNKKTVRIGGIAKGSGMIHPNMATMLSFITTDAAISSTALQQALTASNKLSFNMITVDGDTSTNDMVVVLANGMAQNEKIDSMHHADWQKFCDALAYVCIYLAKEVARDGEGATKLIEMQVHGAVNADQAQLAARAVCRSPLVKSAIYGEDANWGRIASALGTSGAEVDPEQLSIELGTMMLLKNGTPLPFDEDAAREILKQKSIVIKANLGKGNAQATGWGCDLTPDYIKINISYRS